MGPDKSSKNSGVGSVSAKAIVKLIDRWIAEEPAVRWGEPSRFRRDKTVVFAGRSNAMLCELAGLVPRNIHRIRCEQERVSLDIADKLLIAMGYEHEWHISLAEE